MMLSKSELMNEMQRAASQKDGDVKNAILQKQLEAFYDDPDEVIYYETDNDGITVPKKAHDVVLDSIKDPAGTEVAVLTADGIVRGKTVPTYISDMVESLMILLDDNNEDKKKETITDFMMLAFLEGRYLK